MQHKRKSSKMVIFGLLAFAIIGGGIYLMVSPMPAPQQPIEKQLDSASLLGQK